MNKNRKLMNAILVSSMLLSGLSLKVSANAASPVKRHGGLDRVETSIAVSTEAYETSENVVLAGWHGQPDALTGTLLATAKQAPLLLVNKYDTKLRAELTRLGTKTVYLLGEDAAISTEVEAAIKADGLAVKRVSGKDRFDTAVAVAKEVNAKSDHAFLTNDGRSGELADALAAGPASGKNASPILLTSQTGLPSQTAEAFKELGIKSVTIVGGPTAVSGNVEKQLKALGITFDRVAGDNRWETAEKVAETYFADSDRVIVANDGRVSYADALVGGYLGAKLDAPILLTQAGKLNEPTTKFLGSNAMFAHVLGSETVVLNSTFRAIEDIVEGNVSAAEEIVESVNTIADIKVVFDGTYELPLDVEVILSDNRTVTVPVIWDDSAVEVNKAGTYQVVGKLDISALGNVAETDLTASVNVVVAPRVDVESISLSHTELTLTEEENISLSATVLPKDATNKNLLWSSSDENIATVNEQGVVQANSAGEAVITVTDTSGNITEDVSVTVKKPTIASIEDITTHITQHDTYTLPTTVTALMSNGTTQEYLINWLDGNVDTSVLGEQNFEGTVEGYAQSITLSLIVQEYEPQISTNSYSSITINGVSKGLSLGINNNGTKPVNIEKIEVYERGKLSTTYTSQTLIDSGISTVVQPNEPWGISISYKLGIWLDNSYVKYYLSTNNTNYEYEDSLDKN